MSTTTTTHGTSYPYTAADHNRTQQLQLRSIQHPGLGRPTDGRMSPGMSPVMHHGYHSMPGQYPLGRTSPVYGPGQKKTRALPQLPHGKEPMGKRLYYYDV